MSPSPSQELKTLFFKKKKGKYLTGRAVLLQFKGQGPVGSSFTGHHLPARNYLY